MYRETQLMLSCLIRGAGFEVLLVAMQGRNYVVSLYRIGESFVFNNGVQAYRLQE
jgi:hypothetical protein